MQEQPLLDLVVTEIPVSREEILKAIIANGILANSSIDPKGWASSKLNSANLSSLGWFERSVNRAYQVLFEEELTDEFEKSIT